MRIVSYILPYISNLPKIFVRRFENVAPYALPDTTNDSYWSQQLIRQWSVVTGHSCGHPSVNEPMIKCNSCNVLKFLPEPMITSKQTARIYVYGHERIRVKGYLLLDIRFGARTGPSFRAADLHTYSCNKPLDSITLFQAYCYHQCTKLHCC